MIVERIRGGAGGVDTWPDKLGRAGYQVRRGCDGAPALRCSMGRSYGLVESRRLRLRMHMPAVVRIVNRELVTKPVDAS